MDDGARRRLPRHERRAQLIEIGRRHAERSSFDEVSTDEVAAEAGISRGLLFHYFPTRDDFVRAIAEDAAEELLEVTDPDPGLDPVVRLRAGLAAYLDFVAQRPDAYLALIRGAAGGNAQMQEIFERTRGTLARRILDGLGIDPDSAPGILRHLARGFVAFNEEVAVSWLRSGTRDPSRQELLRLLERAALGLLAAAGIQLEAPEELVD